MTDRSPSPASRQPPSPGTISPFLRLTPDGRAECGSRAVGVYARELIVRSDSGGSVVAREPAVSSTALAVSLEPIDITQIDLCSGSLVSGVESDGRGGEVGTIAIAPNPVRPGATITIGGLPCVPDEVVVYDVSGRVVLRVTPDAAVSEVILEGGLTRSGAHALVARCGDRIHRSQRIVR